MMKGGRRVCIKCHSTEKLRAVHVCANELVVGLLFACVNCFDEIQGYELEIFFSKKSDGTEETNHMGMKLH